MPTVLIDTDIGDDIDDVFALAYALGEPSLDILAITTVFRDTAKRTQLVLQLLERYGRLDIPVAPGIGSPLMGNCKVDCIPTYWDDSAKQIQSTCAVDAVHAIIDAARNHPDLIILAIGPLTNLACAIRIAPEVMRNVPIWSMCGMHTATYAEWNIVCDPEAANIVFSEYNNIRMLGLDVTLQCRMQEEELQKIYGLKDSRSQLISTWAQKWQSSSNHLPILHDPLVIAALCHPELVTFQPMQLYVACQGENARGMTLRRKDVFWGSEPPANVLAATEVNAQLFTQLFYQSAFPGLTL